MFRNRSRLAACCRAPDRDRTRPRRVWWWRRRRQRRRRFVDDQDDRAATTTTAAPVIAPLTGMVDPTGESQSRPVLTVKVENTPDALPQWGIDQADVVYEEIVEGNITRLAAMFNSHAPDKIGPDPFGAQHRPGDRVARRRHLRLLRRRTDLREEHQRRAGQPDRRGQRRRRHVPRLVAASVRTTSSASAPTCSRRVANPCRRRRCSRTAPRRADHRRADRIVRRRLQGPAEPSGDLDVERDRGHVHPQPVRRPTRSPAPARRSRRRTSSCSS